VVNYRGTQVTTHIFKFNINEEKGGVEKSKSKILLKSKTKKI